MRRVVILLLAAVLALLPSGAARAQGTLRIGMTASGSDSSATRSTSR